MKPKLFRDSPTAAVRSRSRRPHGLILQQTPGELHASFRLFTWRRFLILAAWVAIALLVGASFARVASEGAVQPEGRGELVLGACALVILLTGLFGLYAALGLLLNKTYLEVVGGELRAYDRPLALRRKRAVVRCQDVARLGVESVDVRWMGTQFSLVATLREGRRVFLATTPDREIIAVLQSAVERQVGIGVPKGT